MINALILFFTLIVSVALSIFVIKLCEILKEAFLAIKQWRLWK